MQQPTIEMAVRPMAREREAGEAQALHTRDPLDPELLDMLVGVARGSATRLLERLVAAFASDAPRHVRRMRSALADGRGEELRRAAHALKSSAASLGATDLAERCAELEGLATTLAADAGESRIDAIEQEVVRVETALAARLAGEGTHVFR